MMKLKPSMWGVLLGTCLGVLWLIWDWRFLWIVVPVGLGYVGGRFVESRGDIADKFKALFRAIIGR